VSEACLSLNGIQHDTENVWLKPLEWSQFKTENSIEGLLAQVKSDWKGEIDYIIGSDTFYEPSGKVILSELSSTEEFNESCVYLF
jgi:hypothetical protein